MNPSEFFERLPTTFSDASTEQCYVLVVQGKRVKTRSGKSMWASKGAAKNALNLHIEQQGGYNMSKKDSWGDMRKHWIDTNVKVMSEVEWLKMKAELGL
jgi:hypothetical protein